MRTQSPVFAAEARKQGSGFTLLEFVVVVIVISVLATVALNRLWALQARAERTAVEQMLGGLRSALGIKVAQFIAKGDRAGIASLIDSNPMDQLVNIPVNYVGVLRDRGADQVTGGHWYFDAQGRTLEYRIRNERYFVGADKRVRFAVIPVYEDRNRNGRFDRGDLIQGIRLAPVEPYRWTE
jgi:prepilin-type N-terminal cleavage/methylation domain-containing protein